MLGRWAGWDVLVLQWQGHEARAELQTANTTFGIQSAHLNNGPWKQVLEPYGKQLELPSRLQAFANVKKKKEEMRSLAWGMCHYGPLLQYYARTACILWWSSATCNMCHVFAKAEVTKWSYFYLCQSISTRTAFIKHGLRFYLISLQFYFVFAFEAQGKW